MYMLCICYVYVMENGLANDNMHVKILELMFIPFNCLIIAFVF